MVEHVGMVEQVCSERTHSSVTSPSPGDIMNLSWWASQTYEMSEGFSNPGKSWLHSVGPNP